MVKRFYVVVLFVFVGYLWSGEIVMTRVFSKDGFMVKHLGDYDIVELKGFPSETRIGEPRLPDVRENVLIPSGSIPLGVEIISQEVEELPGEYNIIPTQKDVPLPMPGKNFEIEPPLPNPYIYSQDKIYPYEKITLLGSGNKNGFTIAEVRLYPVQYNPIKKKLYLTTKITYKVKYEEGKTVNFIPTEFQKRVFGDEIKSIVSNPGDVERFSPVVGRSVNFAPSILTPDTVLYVVISEPPIDTCFNRLVYWKTKKGVPARLVTRTWINSNYTGVDIQEKIRKFIIDAKNNWGTIYVLLGGAADHKTSGENIIPSRDAWYITSNAGFYYDEDTIPCDLYYADLDGTWNADGDNVFGELTDNVDMFADVYVGRASVDNIQEAQNFVNKVLAYEKNPPSGYVKKMLLPSAILWDLYEESDYLQDSIADMTPAGWTDTKLYQRLGNLSAQTMQDALNAGQGLGQWNGHGNQDGIYLSTSEPYLTSSLADGLTNGNKLGIFNSIACFTGAWDETPSGDCFAEHLVNRVGGGAIAVIFNTRYGWGAVYGGDYVPGPSERIDTTFHRRIFYDGLYKLGQVHHAAKDQWVPYADSTGRYAKTRWCIYELSLFGDPELPIWTDEPQTIVANFPSTVPIGSSVLTISVKKSDGITPLSNALVCVMKGEEVYKFNYTDGTGSVSFNVSPSSIGFIYLTITAKNYKPFEDSIQVITSNSPYIVLSTYSILDTITGSGNKNYEINPGETFDMVVRVKNYGSLTGYSVTGTFYEYSIYSSMVQSNTSFGNIPAGDSAISTIPFRISVLSSATDGTVLPCTLFVKDINDSIWRSPLTLTVKGIPIVKLSMDSLVFDYSFKKFGIIDGSKGEIDTIQYDTGVNGLGWTFQNVYPNFGVRFTPLQNCRIIGAIFGLRHTLAVYDTAYLYDAGATSPSTLIEKVPFLTQIAPANVPVWHYVSFSGNYEDANDFWIAGYQNYSLDPLSWVGSSVGSGQRSYYRDFGGNWWQLYSIGYNYDLMVRAVVSYGAPTTDSGIIWIKNIGSGTIIVDTIYVKNHSTWIKSLNPVKFASIVPGDSGGFWVKIDTAGLIRSGVYVDTIVISSNAGSKGLNYLPIIIRFSPTGIAVTEMAAYEINGDIQIIWNVAGDGTVVIERKLNNESFEIIGEVFCDKRGLYSFTDRTIEKEGKYTYRLKGKETGEVYAETEVEYIGRKPSFKIITDYNASILKISFNTFEKGNVSLGLYDITGREIRNILKDNLIDKGNYQYSIPLPKNGIYFVRLKKDGISLTERILILR
uniref:T9SS type A sorting domain-containing protein n=1 Tax=candidate division WOR-3 bacterium TaxID=2052148 RepID=A0A7C4U717_UNCW3